MQFFSFPAGLSEPAANILVGWSDVAYALAWGSDVVPQVTDPDARSQAIVDVYIGSNPDDSIVLGDTDTAFWWYVDRDIDVTGSGYFTESADTGTLTFAVNLKAGWNSVV